MAFTVKAYSYSKEKDVKLSNNFKVSEFRCNDGSEVVLISPELVDLLQKIRNYFKAPIIINSAYRTPTYNKKIGGESNSQHMYGIAADIVVKGIKPATVAAYAEKLIGNGGGVGRYSSFTHVDVRGYKARWNG